MEENEWAPKWRTLSERLNSPAIKMGSYYVTGDEEKMSEIRVVSGQIALIAHVETIHL